MLYLIVIIDINQGRGLKKTIRIVYIKNIHNARRRHTSKQNQASIKQTEDDPTP